MDHTHNNLASEIDINRDNQRLVCFVQLCITCMSDTRTDPCGATRTCLGPLSATTEAESSAIYASS